MPGVGADHDIGRVDAARLLLPDALEDALRARALDAHRYPWIFRLEAFRELLGEWQIEPGVEGDLAFAARRVDQLRRDGGRRRRGGLGRLGENEAGCKQAGALSASRLE